MNPARHASDAQMDAASWCRHLVPDGSVYAFLADHRHQLFPPELFADVVRHGGGHPSVLAEVVATVMVLQALEGLSDREAINTQQRLLPAWVVLWLVGPPGHAQDSPARPQAGAAVPLP
jgi:hypothetical protein